MSLTLARTLLSLVREALLYVDQLPHVRRAHLFARAFVPLIVIIAASTALVGLGPFSVQEDQVMGFRLRSSLTSVSSDSADGFALIFNPGVERERVAIVTSWTETPAPLLSSLDPEVIEWNRENILVHEGGVRVALPLEGTAEPFVITSTSGIGKNLGVGSRSIALAELIPSPQRYASLVFVADLVVVFAFGWSLRRSA